MLGNIIKIEGKVIKVENLQKVSLINIIGYYVIFEGLQNLVGEIVFVNEEEFHIVLVGEIKNNNFIPGFENYPAINSKVRVIYQNELELIIGSQNINMPENLLLGKSTVFDGFNVSVKINDFFSNHFAIVGNTGSGKSCAFARVMQNVFANNKQNPINSHIVVFDIYGEYISAFSEISNHDKINFKDISANNLKNPTVNSLKIPIYLLDVDDLALLLHLEDPSLLNVLEKTIKYVKIFKGDEATCLKYKNSIIIETFIDVLSSGKSSQALSDQALAFLSKYNTKELNLETIVPQPGYNRTIRQCLNIDSQGKVAALELLVEFLKGFEKIDLEKIDILPCWYNMEELYNALELAIISEGSFNSESIFEKMNVLKARLHSLMIGDSKVIFEYDKFISKEEYIKEIFTAQNGEKAQLVDIHFNGIDDRLSKVIVKILVKMFYCYTISLEEKGSYPINVIIEEAHKFINSDNDENVIGYNVFDKVAKEGRKYGILLGIVTQRLCELSENVLSQCSNFVVLKLYYPDDIQMISTISSNITMDTIEKVKSLRPGTALIFGNAFKIPLIVQFDLPNPMPTSINVDIREKWYLDNNQN